MDEIMWPLSCFVTRPEVQALSFPEAGNPVSSSAFLVSRFRGNDRVSLLAPLLEPLRDSFWRSSSYNRDKGTTQQMISFNKEDYNAALPDRLSATTGHFCR